ncbi:hypothetical protein DI09_138p20 [Mitosporidium daphniae]|uniref:Uncharacterized protein n=1 Tax=Mitosporidium daphniae TaxID=1485682 RepID=A0A098VUF9_9MICR|nr:uncharacterized protein DI09_138p20 [Mitosporidium daphniae]KGG52758.1 hypothetical protein DI09_138p20 [Mitosporidium daphniae]|eukprot:XP_013239194.1 uncharacterized protein DI09_138p20 [Mitosporidium daphniae]
MKLSESPIAQILFLFDISCAQHVLFDMGLFVQIIQSIILQLSFIINSALINIIAKAIDLKIPPPILRYRSKCFHPIHTEHAELGKLFSYIKSMMPKSHDPSPYSWDIVKLYLLHAFSDYPWSHSSSDSSLKIILLFSDCFNSIDLVLFSDLLPAFSSNQVKLAIVTDHNTPLQIEAFKPFISRSSFSSLTANISHLFGMGFQPSPHHLKKIIKHLENRKRAAFLAHSDAAVRNSDPLQNIEDIISANDVFAELADLRSLFVSIPGLKPHSFENFVLFTYFYFLFSAASDELIIQSLNLTLDACNDGLLLEFFCLSSDCRSLLLDVIENAHTKHHRLAPHLSEGLFESIHALATYFRTKKAIRSDPLLRILFIVSPLGCRIFLGYKDLYSLLEDLTISFLISGAIMCEDSCPSMEKDIELLQKALNFAPGHDGPRGWSSDQLSQIKEAISEIFQSPEDISEPEIMTTVALNSENTPAGSSADIQSTSSQSFFTGLGAASRHFLQTHSSLTSIEVLTPGTVESACGSSSQPINTGILVHETPTKECPNTFTPMALNLDDDHNIVIAETPKKFISCKRSLQY